MRYSCLALVTDAFGGYGGIARYNRDFLSALCRLSFIGSVRVLPRLAPSDVKETLPPGLHQDPARSNVILYILAACWTAVRRPINFVFCGHIHLAPVCAILAWFKGAKLVVQTHGIEVWGSLPRSQRWALERADMVFCVSRHTRAMVLNAAMIPPELLVVLPNTVSEEFSPGDGLAFRRRHNLDGKRVLLTVGRVDKREHYKGHDRVIAALPSLVSRGHDMAYVIAGSGDDVGRLQALAQAAGVKDRVHFLGAIALPELIQAYRMADLFVMPSTGEGFGIVFLEAMACGTQAVGLAVAGACDALADGELGTVVTESQFADAVSRALVSPGEAASIRVAKVKARFGQDKFVDRLTTSLERILASA